MGCPELTPIGNFWPRPRPDHQTGVRLEFPTKKHSISPSLVPYQICPREPPFTDSSTHPVTAKEKNHQVTPVQNGFKNQSKWTPFHTPNLTPIQISYHCYFHSPNPSFTSHMGFTRTPRWPHGSHCTCHQGWIPLPGPVLDSVVHPVVYRG